LLKSNKNSNILIYEEKEKKDNHINNDINYKKSETNSKEETMALELPLINAQEELFFDKSHTMEKKEKVIILERNTTFRETIRAVLLKTKKKDNFSKNFFYREESDESDNYEEDEDDYPNNHSKLISHKCQNIVRQLMENKKSNDFKEYMDNYKKRVNESLSLCYKIKLIFHNDNSFMVLWKTFLRTFHIFILFVFFFRYVLLTLTKLDKDSSVIPFRILTIYYIINIIFAVDVIFSLLVIIANGGSTLLYIKLLLKIYSCIPFKLKKENIYFILPKFIPKLSSMSPSHV
jgi:hypothetical protein